MLQAVAYAANKTFLFSLRINLSFWEFVLEGLHSRKVIILIMLWY